MLHDQIDPERGSEYPTKMLKKKNGFRLFYLENFLFELKGRKVSINTDKQPVTLYRKGFWLLRY